MKKYIQYIFLALIAGLISVSCIQELELETPVAENDVVTLVPRVQSFTNQYVTKAEGNNETDIKTLNVLIFNEAGNLVYSKSHTGELSSVTLNKSMLNLTNATIVMIANVDLSTVKYDTSSLSTAVMAKSVTLSDMENYVCHFSDALLTEVPVSGLPMIGGTKVTADQANDSALAISLKILYSKVSFNISVENGSENYGTGMEFTLSGATITNLAGATPFAVPTETGKAICDFLGNPVLTETGEETNAETDGYTDSGYIVKNTDGDARALTITGASGNTKVGATTPLSFTFYIPENRYNHGGLTGIYPDASWTNSTTSSLYDSYKQHYKPALAAKSGGAGMPSYVTLTGTYVDYRGTSWDVNYTVYLGKDNYQNFQVDRNSQYTNYITIKGIRNNDSYTDAGSVWMDHRVEASLAANQGADDCITITRETLIDSHIEVRPLRINMGTKYDAALIYLPKYPLDNQGKIINDPNIQPSSWGQIAEKQGGTNENWIAIENNNGSKIKGKLYCLNGKRKYFTTSLIEELHLENDAEGIGIQTDTDGNRYIALSNGDCAWIYFDENLTSNKRKARIDVVFYRTSDNTRITESYDICQAGLKPIGGYFIEEYEEYLHSYDSDDIFYEYDLSTNPTDYTQKGLAWGMLQTDKSGNQIGQKLSDSHVVKSVAEGYELLTERYDYYHAKDGSFYIFQKNADASWSEVDKSTNTGLKFTARASAKDNMSIIDMGTRPTSAYQYCLSKNKFQEDPNGDQHSMMIQWYLPDVHEISSILTNAGEGTFKDMAQGSYYWSSQPSFTTSLLQIADEDDEYARAVSVNEIKPADIHRKEQHRIRCVRSPKGEYADMSERVPDGLGGLIMIPMTVKNGGFFHREGWIEELQNEITPYPSPIPTYRFPMGSSDPNSSKANRDFGGKVDDDGRHYYSKNPLDRKSWETIVSDNWYSTIHESNWPGLTEYKERNISIAGYSAVAELTNEYKSIERTETVRVGGKIDGIPDNVSSISLDHKDGTDNLYIAFGAGTNQSLGPLYEYYSEDASKTNKKIWTKYWQVPTYTPDPANGKEESFKGSDRTLESTAETERLLKNEQLGRNGYEIKSSKVVRTGDKWYNYKYHYEIVACKNKYYYTAAGGWSEEQQTYNGSESPKSSKDALTIYGGNTFTITASKGYRIRSIKVNYSGSNAIGSLGIGGLTVNRFLRLVDALPESTNIHPSNMTYSPDGDKGWFKWTATSNTIGESGVTLNLVTYIVTPSVNIFGSTIASSYEYSAPSKETGYPSDFETSIVIDSFEIRLEEVEE